MDLDPPDRAASPGGRTLRSGRSLPAGPTLAAVAGLTWALAAGVGWRVGVPDSADAELPRSEVLRWGAIGHSEQAASIVWVHTSARWADDRHLAPEALLRAVGDIGDLDPQWLTPWIYGALMLEAQGDRSSHEALLVEAASRHGDAAVFPYALAMSHRARGDFSGAAAWMELAADRPDAPAIHRRAAAVLRTRASR